MKRTTRLLGLVTAALLLAACSTAEEAGGTATEAGGDVAVSEPAPAESEVISEPTLQETSEPATDTGDADADADGGGADGDLLSVARDNPQLSQLVTALQAAGLTDVLEQAGPLTVFAPNNNAFSQIDQNDLTALLSNPQELTGVLQHHVVEGSYPSSELTDGQTLTTLAGEELTVSVDGSTVMVGGAEVVQPDLEAGNGVIHVIDQVLQP
jgi:uncharacterized surface protein with fasciclin (FAS1) repeats